MSTEPTDTSGYGDTESIEHIALRLSRRILERRWRQARDEAERSEADDAPHVNHFIHERVDYNDPDTVAGGVREESVARQAERIVDELRGDTAEACYGLVPQMLSLETIVHRLTQFLIEHAEQIDAERRETSRLRSQRDDAWRQARRYESALRWVLAADDPNLISHVVRGFLACEEPQVAG